MAHDRLTRLGISGLRTLRNVSLSLNGLRVLIGENGSGKSSVLEGLELLRRASQPGFLRELNSVHRGVRLLSLPEQADLTLSAEMSLQPEGRRIEYQLVLQAAGHFLAVKSEGMRFLDAAIGSRERQLMISSASHADLFNLDNAPDFRLSHGEETGLFGASQHPSAETVRRFQRVLSEIRIHLPFDLGALWARKAAQRRTPMREAQTLVPVAQLERFGDNIASAIFHLKNEKGWARKLDLLRLGLGERLREVKVHADPGGGAVGLEAIFDEIGSVFASDLSDGELSYLGHVALTSLTPAGALLAFDEPETHLHPRLMGRIVGLYEELAKSGSVVLSTHSDLLLDALANPAKAVVLCAKKEAGTEMQSADEAELGRWLEKYRSFADLRQGGHEEAIFTSRS